VNRALGLAGIVVALVAAVAAVAVLVAGIRSGRRDRLQAGRSYAFVVGIGALVAFLAMERALITRDFTVAYVAEHGSSTTPALFNVATLWSALEGSILLWALILAGYLVTVAQRFRRRLDDPLVAWALVSMFGITACFLLILLVAANPFQPFDPPPGFDGPGPNPLLQNHILVAFHPPMLYLGYVGFVVPFSFAIGSLVSGRVGEGWLVETRRWTLVAWGFLTAGIVLGGWWSYEVLGWGGYWAWDPVENASLLPWITGTAYLHSVVVQERQGMLRVWNISLLCATFSLTILGTFLTRSGVVESVHAFASGAVGPMLLALFAAVVMVSLGLIAWRADRLRSVGRIDSPVSREGAFLANNLVLAAFAFVVLLGTVFPLLAEAIDGERLSVGVPYFNRMAMPIGFALLTLMAVAPVMPWRRASSELLRERLFWPAWAGVGTLVVAVIWGARGWAPLIAFLLAGFAAGSALRQLVLGVRRSGWRGLVGRTYGGMVVHLGTVAIAVALAASGSYLRQAEIELGPGESATVGGHVVEYLDTTTTRNARVVTVAVRVRVDGERIFEPRLNRYRRTGQVIGTPSVRVGPTEDVYLALTSSPATAETTGDDGASTDAVGLRVVIQPLVVWVWIGGTVMVLGTVLALIPGRSRRAAETTPGSSVGAPAEGEEPPPTGTASDGPSLPAGEEARR
jgi:cytochrome c-type biogenesis protein CcmF